MACVLWCGVYPHSKSAGNTIEHDSIIENGNYNTTIGGGKWQFYITQYKTVEAKYNFRGSGMNRRTIDASIYDDEEWQGEVDFYPFETEPAPCAPTPEAPHTFTTTDAVIALQIAAARPTCDGMSAATSASPRSMR